MEDERLLIKKKVQKYRAVRADVEAVMRKRSRYHLRISKPIFFFTISFKIWSFYKYPCVIIINSMITYIYTYSIGNEIDTVQTMPEIMNHNDVEYGTSLSQSDLFDEVVQKAGIVDEAVSQNIKESQEIIENLMIEDDVQYDHIRSNRQSSISEDDGEQADEIDNLANNEEYEQARVIEARNEVLDEIVQIQNWAILNNIQQNILDELLAILRKRLLPRLPKSAKTFLQTQTAKYNIQEIEAADNSIGEFVYFGIAKGLKSCVHENLHENKKILLQINVDGDRCLNRAQSNFGLYYAKFFSIQIYMNHFPLQFISEMPNP